MGRVSSSVDEGDWRAMSLISAFLSSRMSKPMELTSDQRRLSVFSR
jgi:hypothetical protein